WVVRLAREGGRHSHVDLERGARAWVAEQRHRYRRGHFLRAGQGGRVPGHQALHDGVIEAGPQGGSNVVAGFGGDAGTVPSAKELLDLLRLQLSTAGCGPMPAPRASPEAGDSADSSSPSRGRRITTPPHTLGAWRLGPAQRSADRGPQP